MKNKVFISSVIKGYKDHRDVVEEAIVELNRDEGFNFKVICMEKLPAQDKSSQKACLEGVKESHIYLGIFGERYGWKDNPVGISPTHEEFRQAVKDKKHRLVFVEKVERRDPRQDELLEEIGDYVEGRFWNEFETLGELKHKVYRALLNLMKAGLEEYVPDYLRALLRKYERIVRPWEEDVDSLRVSETVQLEFVEKQQKEEKKSIVEYDETERPSERIANKSFTLPEAIKENRRLLIIGNPGAGKSTSLQWATYTYAKQILSSPQKDLPIPVHLELKWYKNSLLELIATCFRENSVICDEETLKDWTKKAVFVFFFDGFDDLDDPPKCLKDIKDLISFSEKNRFVITSRKIDTFRDLQNLQFKELEVKQLSDSQIELFIERYLGKEKGSRILKELERHNLLNEARNPLILWLMILGFQGDERQISINKGRLFRNVIENHFLKRWDEKVMPAESDIQKYTDLKIKALSRLAFSMIEDEDSVTIEESKARVIIDDLFREGRASYKDLRDEILRQLFLHHVLVKHGSQVSFWHRSFRDYFAALELMETSLKEPKEFLKCYIREEWKDSILFFVGIMDDPSDFVSRLVQPFWRYFLKPRDQVSFRLSLAAKCIGANNKVNTTTQQKVITQLIAIVRMYEDHTSRRRFFRLMFFPILFDCHKAIRALGETMSKRAAKFLGEYLERGCLKNQKVEDYSDALGQEAVKAIRSMPLTDEIQNSLLSAALWHRDGVARMYAEKILRENMREEIMSKLTQIICNKEEKCEIRRRAILLIRGKALEIDFEAERVILPKGTYANEIINPLVQMALEEDCHDLQVCAVNTLGYYKGEDKEDKILIPLIYALHENPNPDIRANAAYALCRQFSHSARKALIQALDDKDAKVRIRAAHALSFLGTETLEEENEASLKLFRLFHDEDPDVRENAVYTCGIIRKTFTNEELAQLINLLKDENLWVRGGAAESLGRLKARNALDALKQTVEGEKYVYPWTYSIWAILQIESSFSETIEKNGWEYLYIPGLYSDDVRERRIAIFVLRRIGTKISLPFLKELNEDYKRKEGGDEVICAIWDIERRSKV